MMNMAYPVSFKTYASGQVGAFFIDVPEAITAGANRAEALDRAQDALVVALSGYIDDGREWPMASPLQQGQAAVCIPSHAAIKLSIWESMWRRMRRRRYNGGIV